MKKKSLFLTQGGLIAAIYVVLTLIFQPFSFGEVQVRISEMLTVLPFFTPAAIPGLFIGCLIANILGGATLIDVVFGSLATLVAAYLTYRLKDKNLYLAVLPPIICNALVVPFILRYAYNVPLPIYFMIFTVGIGEVISAGILGILLGLALKKHSEKIFNLN